MPSNPLPRDAHTVEQDFVRADLVRVSRFDFILISPFHADSFKTSAQWRITGLRAEQAANKRLAESKQVSYTLPMSATVATEDVKARWRTAGRFADVLEAEVKQRRNPLLARVVSWFNLCRVCQDLEEQMVLANQPPVEDLQLHCALLSAAIASGEGLVMESMDAETLRPLRITPQAIRAKLESLRITHEQWHTELKPERQAAILKEAFGGAV